MRQLFAAWQDQSDDEKITSILKGRGPGFGEVESLISHVVRCFNGPLYDEPQDLIQESLIAIYTAIREERFSGRGLKSYCWKTTYQLCLNSNRKWKSRDRRSVDIADVALDDPGDGPETLLSKREDAMAISDIFRSLPYSCKRLLVLKYYKRLSSKEIAKRVGLSSNAVRQRIKRCHDRAKSMLINEESG